MFSYLCSLLRRGLVHCYPDTPRTHGPQVMTYINQLNACSYTYQDFLRYGEDSECVWFYRMLASGTPHYGAHVFIGWN